MAVVIVIGLVCGILNLKKKTCHAVDSHLFLIADQKKKE
jgi:hypothetical protein